MGLINQSPLSSSSDESKWFSMVSGFQSGKGITRSVEAAKYFLKQDSELSLTDKQVMSLEYFIKIHDMDLQSEIEGLEKQLTETRDTNKIKAIRDLIDNLTEKMHQRVYEDVLDFVKDVDNGDTLEKSLQESLKIIFEQVKTTFSIEYKSEEPVKNNLQTLVGSMATRLQKELVSVVTDGADHNYITDEAIEQIHELNQCLEGIKNDKSAEQVAGNLTDLKKHITSLNTHYPHLIRAQKSLMNHIVMLEASQQVLNTELPNDKKEQARVMLLSERLHNGFSEATCIEVLTPLVSSRLPDHHNFQSIDAPHPPTENVAPPEPPTETEIGSVTPPQPPIQDTESFADADTYKQSTITERFNDLIKVFEVEDKKPEQLKSLLNLSVVFLKSCQLSLKESDTDDLDGLDKYKHNKQQLDKIIGQLRPKILHLLALHSEQLNDSDEETPASEQLNDSDKETPASKQCDEIFRYLISFNEKQKDQLREYGIDTDGNVFRDFLKKFGGDIVSLSHDSEADSKYIFLESQKNKLKAFLKELGCKERGVESDAICALWSSFRLSPMHVGSTQDGDDMGKDGMKGAIDGKEGKLGKKGTTKGFDDNKINNCINLIKAIADNFDYGPAVKFFEAKSAADFDCFTLFKKTYDDGNKDFLINFAGTPTVKDDLLAGIRNSELREKLDKLLQNIISSKRDSINLHTKFISNPENFEILQKLKAENPKVHNDTLSLIIFMIDDETKDTLRDLFVNKDITHPLFLKTAREKNTSSYANIMTKIYDNHYLSKFFEERARDRIQDQVSDKLKDILCKDFKLFQNDVFNSLNGESLMAILENIDVKQWFPILELLYKKDKEYFKTCLQAQDSFNINRLVVIVNANESNFLGKDERTDMLALMRGVSTSENNRKKQFVSDIKAAAKSFYLKSLHKKSKPDADINLSKELVKLKSIVEFSLHGLNHVCKFEQDDTLHFKDRLTALSGQTNFNDLMINITALLNDCEPKIREEISKPAGNMVMDSVGLLNRVQNMNEETHIIELDVDELNEIVQVNGHFIFGDTVSIDDIDVTDLSPEHAKKIVHFMLSGKTINIPETLDVTETAVLASFFGLSKIRALLDNTFKPTIAPDSQPLDDLVNDLGSVTDDENFKESISLQQRLLSRRSSYDHTYDRVTEQVAGIIKKQQQYLQSLELNYKDIAKSILNKDIIVETASSLSPPIPPRNLDETPPQLVDAASSVSSDNVVKTLLMLPTLKDISFKDKLTICDNMALSGTLLKDHRLKIGFIKEQIINQELEAVFQSVENGEFDAFDTFVKEHLSLFIDKPSLAYLFVDKINQFFRHDNNDILKTKLISRLMDNVPVQYHQNSDLITFLHHHARNHFHSDRLRETYAKEMFTFTEKYCEDKSKDHNDDINTALLKWTDRYQAQLKTYGSRYSHLPTMQQILAKRCVFKEKKEHTRRFSPSARKQFGFFDDLADFSPTVRKLMIKQLFSSGKYTYQKRDEDYKRLKKILKVYQEKDHHSVKDHQILFESLNEFKNTYAQQFHTLDASLTKHLFRIITHDLMKTNGEFLLHAVPNLQPGDPLYACFRTAMSYSLLESKRFFGKGKQQNVTASMRSTYGTENLKDVREKAVSFVRMASDKTEFKSILDFYGGVVQDVASYQYFSIFQPKKIFGRQPKQIRNDVTDLTAVFSHRVKTSSVHITANDFATFKSQGFDADLLIKDLKKRGYLTLDGYVSSTFNSGTLNLDSKFGNDLKTYLVGVVEGKLEKIKVYDDALNNASDTKVIHKYKEQLIRAGILDENGNIKRYVSSSYTPMLPEKSGEEESKLVYDKQFLARIVKNDTDQELIMDAIKRKFEELITLFDVEFKKVGFAEIQKYNFVEILLADGYLVNGVLDIPADKTAALLNKLTGMFGDSARPLLNTLTHKFGRNDDKQLALLNSIVNSSQGQAFLPADHKEYFHWIQGFNLSGAKKSEGPNYVLKQKLSGYQQWEEGQNFGKGFSFVDIVFKKDPVVSAKLIQSLYKNPRVPTDPLSADYLQRLVLGLESLSDKELVDILFNPTLSIRQRASVLHDFSADRALKLFNFLRDNRDRYKFNPRYFDTIMTFKQLGYVNSEFEITSKKPLQLDFRHHHKVFDSMGVTQLSDTAKGKIRVEADTSLLKWEHFSKFIIENRCNVCDVLNFIEVTLRKKSAAGSVDMSSFYSMFVEVAENKNIPVTQLMYSLMLAAGVNQPELGLPYLLDKFKRVINSKKLGSEYAFLAKASLQKLKDIKPLISKKETFNKVFESFEAQSKGNHVSTKDFSDFYSDLVTAVQAVK
ncbi:hypothetical protein DID76_02425 [Candidatus Marinamargulisbacteria bacterium SCGC AG-414-C22]|nr:hypothetical protein DID76_02425 [Candidatus Marinamargulisbacteria bacterium SCGC AG-414-C22]